MLGTKKNNNMPKKKVLILGGSSDIGISTMNIFLKNNWEVYCHYNSSNILKKKKNKNLKFFKLDFSTTEKQIDSELNYIKKLNFSSIINLVGYMDGDNFENFTISNSLKTIQINSIVPFYIIKKLLPGMIKNRFGRILQTSSIGVKFGGGKNTFNYSLSKKLNEFLPSHVKSLANKNILVNTLIIGVTKTKIHKKIQSKNLRIRKKLIPMQRIAHPDEIAKYIFFISSENNSYVTGQHLTISGGE